MDGRRIMAVAAVRSVWLRTITTQASVVQAWSSDKYKMRMKLPIMF